MLAVEVERARQEVPGGQAARQRASMDSMGCAAAGMPAAFVAEVEQRKAPDLQAAYMDRLRQLALHSSARLSLEQVSCPCAT